MASPKKKTKAKTVVKFRDLKSSKNPKGGGASFGKVDFKIITDREG